MGQFRDILRLYTLVLGAFLVGFFVEWVTTGVMLGGALLGLICSAVFFVFLVAGMMIIYIGLERFTNLYRVLGDAFLDPNRPREMPPRQTQQYPAQTCPDAVGGLLPGAYPAPQGYHAPQMPPYPQQVRLDVEEDDRPLELPSARTMMMVFLASTAVGGLFLSLGPATGNATTVFFIFSFIIGFSFPSFIWMSYVYTQEGARKSPARIVLRAFTWGMLATVPAMLLNTSMLILFSSSMSGEMASFYTAAAVAPVVEEFFKPWGVWLVRNRIRGRLDGIVFGVTCGVGFALIENITYEASFAFGGAEIWTLGALARGLGSIVVHATGAGMIGYAFGRYRCRGESALGGIPMAYILGVGLHSLWNGSSALIGSDTNGTIIQIVFMAAFATSGFFLIRYFLRRAAQKDARQATETVQQAHSPGKL